MEYGTIRIPREEYDRHNQRRKELGVTWAGYIDGHAPDDVDTDALANDVVDALDSAAFNGRLSDDRADELIREVEQIQDLLDMLPERSADEVERRLR